MAPASIIDLSHPLNDKTIHWPSNSGFSYSVQKDGDMKNQQDQAYHLKSDSFSTAAHTGTHIDAPVHFNKQGLTVDKIPLNRLIDVPVTVIDLSSKVKANRSYSFTRQDFLEAQTGAPLVKAHSVVLVYTGVSEDYDKGEQAYFGTPTSNVSILTDLKIPGFSKEAAQLMAEVGVYGVGLDSPSADSSDAIKPSGMNLDAHIVLNGKDIFILENINSRLKELLGQPAGSVRLTIAPLPIVGGSGSPVRLVAVTEHEHGCNCALQRPVNNANRSLGGPASILWASVAAISLSLGLLARRVL